MTLRNSNDINIFLIFGCTYLMAGLAMITFMKNTVLGLPLFLWDCAFWS